MHCFPIVFITVLNCVTEAGVMRVVLATGTTDHDTEVIPLITDRNELTVAAVTL